ncbi:MAG: flagellar type III secretion system pore protein FliP [Planctomycetota bacterium]
MKRSGLKFRLGRVLAGAGLGLAIAPALFAQSGGLTDFDPTAPDNLTVSLKILAILTVLTVAPSILLLTTAFPRIVIVLGFVRRALSLQEVPPTQVLIGLALILTFMVMAPTFNAIKNEALVPYMEHRMSDGRALEVTVGHMRNFMWRHVDFRDLEVMMAISNPDLINAPLEKIPIAEVPTTTLVPAFLLSELKRAFEMGFMIYLPFLVIDLVVASTLISMGMLVLPPVLISLPFKVLIFVLVDGWGKIVEQLAISYS